jgi:transposase
MEDKSRSVRRLHAPELKKAVLDECRAGGSVASVAMAHGLNANLVHKWRRREQGKVVAKATVLNASQTFIPLTIASPAPPPPLSQVGSKSPASVEPRELRIEMRRGALVATVTMPATTETAEWLREVLR